MRVLVDGRCLQGNARGMGIYTGSLLRALARLGEAGRPAVTLLLDRGLPDPVGGIPGGWPVLRAGTWGGQVVWEQRTVPRAAYAGGFDLVHCPANGAPLTSRVPVAVTIHDTIFVRNFREISAVPYPRQLIGHLYRVRRYPRAARNAAAVLTVSEASRRDIERVLGVAPDRITVTPEALPEAFAAATASAAGPLRKLFGLEGPYLLAMGAYERRKNIPLLFDALARSGRPDLKLALAGAENLGASGYPAAVRARGVADRVVFLPYLTDGDLKALYGAAAAFCWPSLREGFGLPLLEAMSCGTPVIASRIPVNEEIAGEAAEYRDPADVDGWAAAMRRAADDGSWRQEVAERGRERVAGFSWDRAAAATRDAWAAVARRPSA